jgi:hypothetical protein
VSRPSTTLLSLHTPWRPLAWVLVIIPKTRSISLIHVGSFLCSAVQLLSALTLLMLYMVFAQGLGMDVANVIAAGTVLLGFW